ncbi:MAG: hypothetical protein ACRKFN_06725 [Desulfitobacterium sp.]
MEGKKVLRALITVGLLVALITVIIVSQGHDPNNPHASIPKEEWLRGEKGHGFAVLNNQNPQEQCYECHAKQGLGGKAYCQSCHDQSGVNYNLPD